MIFELFSYFQVEICYFFFFFYNRDDYENAKIDFVQD